MSIFNRYSLIDIFYQISEEFPHVVIVRPLLEIEIPAILHVTDKCIWGTWEQLFKRCLLL
jgi:hypothetical protein